MASGRQLGVLKRVLVSDHPGRPDVRTTNGERPLVLTDCNRLHDMVPPFVVSYLIGLVTAPVGGGDY